MLTLATRRASARCCLSKLAVTPPPLAHSPLAGVSSGSSGSPAGGGDAATAVTASALRKPSAAPPFASGAGAVVESVEGGAWGGARRVPDADFERILFHT